MPRLTGLAPDPRRPGYRLVEVDRGRFASLPAEALDGLGLVLGEELAPPQFARLRELADFESALRAALRALSHRAYAQSDLRRRLLQRQHPPGAVAAALDRLAAQGLLDDATFARHFAAVRARRGRGPARLVKDLLTHGVDRRVAEAAVRQAFAEEGLDPTVLARTVATRRAAHLAHLPAPIRSRRVLAFLKRRGFEGADIRQLVEQVCGT
ncbi:MAG TPA: regulatory protein RecX [Gemmatimonadales bacterium]|nr:regulatory protein RecX [Gemmatimonadales bacterium]